MAIPTKEDVEAAPDALLDGAYCTRTEDFFLPGARELIGRFLGGFLESLIITPTELVHSASFQKRLNDAGRPLMNAVDKIATLQARHRGENVAARLRDLHALISAAMKRTWEDEKDKPVPAITPDSFSGFVASLSAVGEERDYQIGRALVEHLSQFRVWKDKVTVLVKLYEVTKGRDENRLIEYILAECLRSEAAQDQLFGLFERMEERCYDLIDLWKGDWKPRDTAQPCLVAINTMMAEGTAPAIKASVEYALLRWLASKEPLRSAEPEIEIQAVFDLFKRQWAGTTLIGGPKALTSLERRQARHINNETVTDLLRERRVMTDRYAFLMQLVAMAIGQGNRATLKNFMHHYFANKDFVPRAISGQEPPIPRLQSLTVVHRAIRNSWLSDYDKNEYAPPVEAAQAKLMQTTKLMEEILRKSGSPSQRVLTLLDLCRKGTFIEGPNLDKVKAVIESCIRLPAFLPDYLGNAVDEERERKMTLLTKALGGLGISV